MTRATLTRTRFQIATAIAFALAGAQFASAQTPPASPPPAAATPVPAAAPRPPAPASTIMPPPASQQVDTTFATWDTNHNGSLSLEEFRRGATGMRASAVEGRLHAQFNAVDANKNGAIDGNEYGNLILVKRAGTSAPPLSAFDGNRDQALNFAEYTDLVRRLSPAARTAPAPAPK